MDDFWNDLLRQMEAVEAIGNKIENGGDYLEELKSYLPSLNKMISIILELVQENVFEISTEFLLQVLNDIVYGVENQDTVFLLDVLRYGLQKVFYYIAAELQDGEYNE